MTRSTGPQEPIAIIGAGQLGTSLGKSLLAQGVPKVLACNLPSDTKTRARAEAAGMSWLESPEGLGEARIIFSAVTADSAVHAAKACAPSIHPDAVYIDLNSMGPNEKNAAAEVVTSAGRKFIDGAVLGAAADGIKMPIIVSGENAQAVAERLTLLGMNVRAVGTKSGEAAAIKIVRSVLAKGLEVLYVEALLSAHRLGVDTEVLKTFCDWLDMRPAAASAQILVTTHLLHAERRMHELDMSIAAVRETGVEPVLTQAIRDRLAMTAATGISAQLAGVPPKSTAEALDLLEKIFPKA
ncbi:NAD(P)-binding domain-containing protein [Polaromonas sp.]|uniref:NAD(P)-binding domain-containing protein n=1 Tax=Polaromonas sp. TaxID=1869339 RepID=UPI0025D63E0C|nr:NAD(P)-binding domain-containing protein [Polaromonas sp.]